MDDQHFCKPLEPRRKSYVADDYSIQTTNDDATECKASAVRAGYWPDRFVELFLKKTPAERRPPEIHRGYFARVRIVRDLVDKFLHVNGPNCQIVNLGCGSDTLYWRLRDDHPNEKLFRKFVEIDFSSVTAKKISQILKNGHEILKRTISVNDDEISQSEHRNLSGPDYFLLGADIRDLKELDDRLKLIPDFRPDLPTLFISECVLIYMSCKESYDLCSFLNQKFPKSCFVIYELVNLSDSFGEIFKKNMATRGLTLAGLNICTSLQSQTDRFLNSGWLEAKSYLMTEIYDRFIDQKDRERIEKLEFLDETELLTQLLGHYCVVVAVNQGLQSMIL